MKYTSTLPRWILTSTVLLGIAVGSVGNAQCAENRREMLSSHQTVAQFEGVAYQQCMGMTALCPDKCGSSGDFASFRVLKYLSYEKPGQYGDPKQETFVFQVQDNMKHVKVPEPIQQTVAGLKKGDFALLDWVHEYVTQNGSSSPERVIKKLQKITREEADKLTGGVDKLAPAKAEKQGSTGPGEAGSKRLRRF
jgi:hypothetical protein